MSDYSELKAKAKAATQGEWQVIESKLPCRIGRPHVERRIFTAKDHPQLKAPYPVINGSVALGTDETPVHHMVSMTAADAAYIAAANPATILALIADNELLNAENKQLILLECNGGTAQAAVNLLTDRDQLRAEVAGLKTGYEAYERVNAELKAECEALRKDSESYRLLSFCHGQGTLELVRSHHELCAEIRRLKIIAGEPVPPNPEEFVGPNPEGPTARIRRHIAAMGKGDRP